MSTQPATAPVSDRPAREDQPFLSVRDLTVHFPTDDGLVKAVDGISFDLRRGKTLGIVGESGSGKSVTNQAIFGLHRRSRAIATGEIWLDGKELLGMPDEQLRQLRGQTMAMIFQDPLSAMHPFYTVGHQIVEAIRVHDRGISKDAARNRTVEMLDLVGIPDPSRRFDRYPHEFSGGMRQRAMIAMALVNNPKLLVADEPTTALDVTVQAQILQLMKDMQQEFGTSIIMITHDLGDVAESADDVMVMYGGKAVEKSSTHECFKDPQHPYTWGLLKSMPRLDQTRTERLDPIPGNPPSLINVPSGCAFHPRCVYRDQVSGDQCAGVVPMLADHVLGHSVRCHLTSEQRGILRPVEGR